MALLRPALCSTAFGGGLSSGGPSIPLPSSVFFGAEHRSPGLLEGLWRVGRSALCSASPQETMRGCYT